MAEAALQAQTLSGREFQMFKSLFALSFVSLALIAAKPAEVPAAPKPSINAPAEIAADPANRLNIQLSNGGTVVIQMRPDVAPNHVRRMQTLVTSGFYNGTIFHRVVPGFMAQGGDPTGTGSGDSPLPNLEPEFNALPHMRGVLSMARAEEENSANSQFFIMLAPGFTLDHKYTGFGRVISGMQFVDSITPGEPPENPTKIVRAWLDGPMPQAVAAAPAQPQPQAEVPAPAQPQPEPQAEVPASAQPQPQPQAEVPAPAQPQPQPQAEVPAPAAEQPATDSPKDSPATGG
jgi:cyclophilin family peptidyl-prolyl cis-trans isomerase